MPVPVRTGRGGIGVHELVLTRERSGVPMSAHPSFTPPTQFDGAPALDTVGQGVERILDAVGAHAGAGDAATQMADALSDLMARWVRPMPSVNASRLLRTDLGRHLLTWMCDDPDGCAAAYDEAVDAFPEAGIPRLTGHGDDREMPLWRAGVDGVRERATAADLRDWLDGDGRAPLYPRALLLTALVRLGMCDLFVHGTGGATYDRAMERWIEGWLGVRPAPVAVVSATVRLPLLGDTLPPDTATAVARVRRGWHDPETLDGAGSRGVEKQTLLASIDAAPRNSTERRARFHAMHERLSTLRRDRIDPLDALRAAVDTARAQSAARRVAVRRDWPFPLYDTATLDALAARVREPFV